ncbi:MAG: DNA translocase FtsK 4TM domain-containing protein, partial [Eubacterium sp.]|nr:DNA translocase FtsK 4TM domain-containing protein [Eubacterium sp.]
MAGRKKTTGTRKKTTTAKKTASPKREGASPSAKRKLLGIFLVVLGVYATYAYATATPGIFDKIVGKVIFTYVFGNTTVMANMLIVATGVLVFMNKHREKAQTLVLVLLLLINMMIIFSLNVPRLLTYSVMDLFILAKYGGSGGIVGILLSYFLQMMVTKIGTVFFVILASIAEILLIIRANFKDFYQKLVQDRFGLNTVKEKVDDLVEEKKIAREQREKKKAEDPQEDYDGLFGKTDIGEVSIDTEIIDYQKIREAIGEDGASEDYDHLAVEDDQAETPEAKSAPVRTAEAATVGDELYILKSRDEAGSEEPAEPYVFPSTELLTPSI